MTAAARGSRRLTVGFRVGIAVTPAVRMFADRYPDVLVDVLGFEWNDQAAMLLDGRIDVGYVRPPIDETGLRVTPLYTESRVRSPVGQASGPLSFPWATMEVGTTIRRGGRVVEVCASLIRSASSWAASRPSSSGL